MMWRIIGLFGSIGWSSLALDVYPYVSNGPTMIWVSAMSAFGFCVLTSLEILIFGDTR